MAAVIPGKTTNAPKKRNKGSLKMRLEKLHFQNAKKSQTSFFRKISGFNKSEKTKKQKKSCACWKKTGDFSRIWKLWIFLHFKCKFKKKKTLSPSANAGKTFLFLHFTLLNAKKITPFRACGKKACFSRWKLWKIDFFWAFCNVTCKKNSFFHNFQIVNQSFFPRILDWENSTFYILHCHYACANCFSILSFLRYHLLVILCILAISGSSGIGQSILKVCTFYSVKCKKKKKKLLSRHSANAGRKAFCCILSCKMQQKFTPFCKKIFSRTWELWKITLLFAFGSSKHFDL